MTPIHVIIIDDEISAIKTLRGMLQEYFPEIVIADTASSVSEALEKMSIHKPDLVFLDIEMPPFESGFDFLKQCEEYNFGVIFTTAYPHYAIQAINEFQPWAYLVKPYSVHELKKAIETSEEKIAAERNEKKDPVKMASIVVTDARKGNVVIQIDQILYCKADGVTSDIFYLKNNSVSSITASKTLKDIEELLTENDFFRSHHSYLINLHYIEKFEQTGRNGIIYLSKGQAVPVSVSKMEDFKETLYRFLHKL